MTIGIMVAWPFLAIWRSPVARGPVDVVGFVTGLSWADANEASDTINTLALKPAPHTYLRNGEALMEANEKAPDFSLPDQDGNTVKLKDLRGKTVVLFFYPKADTPG